MHDNNKSSEDLAIKKRNRRVQEQVSLTQFPNGNDVINNQINIKQQLNKSVDFKIRDELENLPFVNSTTDPNNS